MPQQWVKTSAKSNRLFCCQSAIIVCVGVSSLSMPYLIPPTLFVPKKDQEETLYFMSNFMFVCYALVMLAMWRSTIWTRIVCAIKFIAERFQFLVSNISTMEQVIKSSKCRKFTQPPQQYIYKPIKSRSIVHIKKCV